MATDKVKVKCTRCGGTGKHNYNLRDGDTCYGCEGSGFVLKTQAQSNAAEKRREATAKRKTAEKEETDKAVAAFFRKIEEKYGNDQRIADAPPNWKRSHMAQLYELDCNRAGKKAIKAYQYDYVNCPEL